MSKIYVASSWRNSYQPFVVEHLRNDGHEVYDFRHPFHGNSGFHWSDIDTDWQAWDPKAYRAALMHPIAGEGFDSDYGAMQWADTCVLVLPCGRSAHAEAGWMAGQGKRTIVYIPEPVEPELMYLLFGQICVSMSDVRDALAVIAA